MVSSLGIALVFLTELNIVFKSTQSPADFGFIALFFFFFLKIGKLINESQLPDVLKDLNGNHDENSLALWS